MINYYAIKICPNCNQRIPIEYDFSNQVDDTLKIGREVLCADCHTIFGATITNDDTIYGIDSDEIQTNNSDVNDSKYLSNHYNQILEYIHLKYKMNNTSNIPISKTVTEIKNGFIDKINQLENDIHDFENIRKEYENRIWGKIRFKEEILFNRHFELKCYNEIVTINKYLKDYF